MQLSALITKLELPRTIIVSVYFLMSFSVPPKKISPTKEGLIFWTDGQTDRQTDGQTDRNFVEILGKLCFARLKLNLKTEDRFKLKTKLGYRTRRS